MFQTLDQLWLASVRVAPTAPALLEGGTGRIWSRAALLAEAENWRSSLSPGITLRGRRVVFAEPNGPGWLVIFIGLQLAGAIAVPLDPTEPACSRRSYAEAVGAAWSWENGRLEPVAARPPARRRDLCLVKLTSGSTGKPRALVFTHQQMIADGRQICASMAIGPDDLNLGVIPFGHSYGLGNLVIPLLVQGTPILTPDSPLPQALASDCRKWKPTVFPAVPTLLRALISAEIDPGALASLRRVISAGAPLTVEVAVAFHDRFHQRVHSFYGTSETGGITYDGSGDASLTGRSVGPPLQGVKLTPRGGGRFWVESDAVMGRGRTSPSDRAQLNEQGELVLLGRTGRTAKIAGRRVDLSEIEHTLRSIPGVRDAYVMQHPSVLEGLAAAVAGTMDTASLRRELRARTASWKIPGRLLVLPDLPRNARGKIDRRPLEALLAGDLPRRAPHPNQPPRP